MKFHLIYRAALFLVMSIHQPLFASADYIGESNCQACHLAEYQAWRGSHHQLAMQPADTATVLGDFNQARFNKDGVTTTFFTQGERFMVNTDGPEGSLQDFEVSYVFGVDPLQQYMVEFPAGKIQVLDIAWDTRPIEQGGQRWFSLHPDDKIPAGDVAHWTGPNMNWNYMCADCHSTNLQKNYDASTDSYATRWTDISVSCEACHGPGSEHKTWADNLVNGVEYKVENKGLTAVLNERKGVQWHTGEETGLPVRSKANESRAEIQVCARCHSRRSQLTDDFVPGQQFMNAYHPSLLADGLYYADGQMQDEVYVWGSFRQSKMYQAGVTCSDCHDPHTAQLKASGEQVCYQCHAPGQYASEKHHFHQSDSEGASCISCHMPATTLMGVDERNDHSFRIPRPDVSLSEDTPNACNQCHRVQTAGWADNQLQKWYGKKPRGYQDFAPALYAARRAALDAPRLLLELAADSKKPGIARATALSHLGAGLNQASFMLIQQSLNDDDPLIRLGGLMALEPVPIEQRIIALPAVWDEVRSVRIEAARLLAGYQAGQLGEKRQAKLDSAIEEYIQTQEYNRERPQAQLNLAGVYQDRRQFYKAEQAYRQSLKLGPQYVPAYINFSNMLSQMRRENEAVELLSSGIARVPEPESAAIYHARGLSKIRLQNHADSIADLARAAELVSENSRYQYIYAIALQSVGNIDEALDVLQASLAQNGLDLDTVFALATINRDAGRKQAAMEYARQLQALLPNDPGIEQLILSINE